MIAPNKEHTVMTIGYEGLDLEHFLKFLTFNEVEVLVDVREIPLSRKKGFSKSLLAETLEDNGIGYQHIKALGSPKPIRDRLKSDWDYDAFFSAYDDYLETQDEALDALGEIIEDHRKVCLMCFESSHDQCHRSHVAKRIAQNFQDLNVEPVNTWVK